jgi:hypothetical protein
VSGNETTAFLAFDQSTGRWERLPTPSHRDRLRLVATDNLVVAYHWEQETEMRADLAYDPVTGSWAELPVDPLRPLFSRSMVWTGQDLVLLGSGIRSSNPSEQLVLYRAAALSPSAGTWRRFPDSEITGWSTDWFAADGQIINPAIGTADGGANVATGRVFPVGGILDTITGSWSDLPSTPSEIGQYRGPAVGGASYVVAEGWALHVPTRQWLLVPALPALQVGQAAVWASDRLIVWGGVGWEGDTAFNLSRGWEWVP